MEYDRILFSRLVPAFLWTVALHFFPLFVYVFVTNADVVHPLDWTLKSLLLVFSIKTWVILIPAHSMLFAIGCISAQELKKQPPFITSRFKFVCSFFTSTNIIKLFLYTLLGITIPWTYLKFSNDGFTKQCSEISLQKNLCLDEYSVFIVTCGFWTAVYYFIKYEFLTDKYLEFPIIRQLRFLQIRSKFLSGFKNCFKVSVIPVFYFLLFFLWYGHQVCSFFEVFFAAYLETSTLTRIYGLFNFSLLIKAWLLSSAFITIVETFQLMIQVHFTEFYSFALVPQPNPNEVLLPTALTEQSNVIIQHLACYNLYIVSNSQKGVRWQVFTLSQPGGHPHTWNAILHESLKLIDKFINEVEQTNKPPEVVEPPQSPIPRHYHSRDMSERHEDIFTGPVPKSPMVKLRRLVDEPHPRLFYPEKMEKTAMDELWAKVESFAEVVQQNPVVKYIFGSKPDARICYLVSNTQPLIWVIQSIAELSANALMEDQFGIVLKDLPLIINTLLRLKCSLDKLGTTQKKFQKHDRCLCMKATLRSALRRSLYRIAVVYSDYLTDLPLPPENLGIMKNFVHFKEC